MNKTYIEMYQYKEGIGYTNGVAFAVDQWTLQPSDDGNILMVDYFVKVDDQIIPVSHDIPLTGEYRFRTFALEGDGKYAGLVTFEQAMETLGITDYVTDVSAY